MPIYEYTCANQHTFERIEPFREIGVGGLTACPTCGAMAERQQFSTSAWQWGPQDQYARAPGARQKPLVHRR